MIAMGTVKGRCYPVNQIEASAVNRKRCSRCRPCKSDEYRERRARKTEGGVA